MRVELEVCVDGRVSHRFAVGDHPVLVGRGDRCGIVLLHPRISWHHLLVWIEAGQLWVRDLASTHGSGVGGRALAPMTSEAIGIGQEVVLAEVARIRVLAQPHAPVASLLVEDQDAGVAYPLAAGWHGIGEDGMGLGPPGQLPALRVGAAVHLVTATGSREVSAGDGFEAAGRSYRLRRLDGPADRLTQVTGGLPFVLSVTLNGPTGPEATLRDPRTLHAVRVDGDVRNSLLYLLARRLVRDVEDGVPASDAGWVGHDELASGIWGRAGGIDPSGKLKVVVRRLRKQLGAAKFPRELIETRRGAIRIRVAQAVIG